MISQVWFSSLIRNVDLTKKRESDIIKEKMKYEIRQKKIVIRDTLFFTPINIFIRSGISWTVHIDRIKRIYKINRDTSSWIQKHTVGVWANQEFTDFSLTKSCIGIK